MVKVWRWLWRPSARWSLGVLLVFGFVVGIMFWGTFHWVIELTNTETFCVSCHEMRDTPYAELKETIHYSNRSGVRAICSDCHVPKDWAPKMLRKIQATSDLYHMIMGTVDTPEKFKAKRLELAKNVWESMKASDSRECRNCHQAESMKLSVQVRQAQGKHHRVQEGGSTCIDCHQGIAHHLPDKWEDSYPK